MVIILVASEIPCRIHQVLTLRHLSFPISETECAKFYGGGKYMVYNKKHGTYLPESELWITKFKIHRMYNTFQSTIQWNGHRATWAFGCGMIWKIMEHMLPILLQLVQAHQWLQKAIVNDGLGLVSHGWTKQKQKLRPNMKHWHWFQVSNQLRNEIWWK